MISVHSTATKDMDRNDDNNYGDPTDDYRSAISHISTVSSLTGGNKSSHSTKTNTIYYSPRQTGDRMKENAISSVHSKSVDDGNNKMSLGRSDASQGRDYYDISTIGTSTVGTSQETMSSVSHTGSSSMKSNTSLNQRKSRMKWKRLRKHAPRLARMGQNIIVKSNHLHLPRELSKYEVFVDVKIDSRARSSSYLEDKIKSTLKEELQASYCCMKDDNPFLILKVDVVLLADGSLSQSMLDGNAVVGLVELGCIWQLRKASDRESKDYFEAGLISEYEDVGYGITDMLFQSKGEQCLLENLAPRLAKGIVSKIGTSDAEIVDKAEV